MGQVKIMPQGGNIKDDQLTLETIQKCINELFKVDHTQSSLESIMPSILIISRSISQNNPFSIKEDCPYVNPAMLRCFYHPQFQNTLKWMVELLSRQLKTIMDARFIMLISREKFRKCLNLAKFCLFFLDQTLILTINQLKSKQNIHTQSHNLLDELTKERRQISNICLLKTFPPEKRSILTTIFIAALQMMMDLHLKIISRSDFTMKTIDELNYSIFILYYQEICKLERVQHCKNLIKIGAYFMGSGFEHNIPSIFQSAGLLLSSVIEECNQNLSETKALPSHLFKSLPIVNNSEMIQWITCSLIFSLKYIKIGTNYQSKLNINRILSFKLLELIIKKMQPLGEQITFMLEELCFQTKLELIERIYLGSIAQKYSKLINDKSEIIKGFIQAKNISFNVNLPNEKLYVKSSEVFQELQKDNERLQNQMVKVHAKYIQQVIFHHSKLIYDYSDKALWNFLLTNLKGQKQHKPNYQKGLNEQNEEIYYFENS